MQDLEHKLFKEVLNQICRGVVGATPWNIILFVLSHEVLKCHLK